MSSSLEVPRAERETRIVASNQLGPRSDLTYQLLENKQIDGVDLSNSMFQGAILRNCTFKSCNFFRSDFDATRIERCSFMNCNMVGDFRSALVADSAFTDCEMSTSYIRSTNFIKTSFNKSVMSDSAISENNFIECTLEACTFAMSSFLNNKCIGSVFKNVFFGDCTLLYVIMKSCKFSNCAMNLESVGTIYGLTEANIRKFNYYYRGEPQKIYQKQSIFKILLQEYSRRGWRLGVCVLRLNMSRDSVFMTIRSYLAAYGRDIDGGGMANKEELAFVVDLFDELALEERLPLVSCLDALAMAAAATEALAENTAQARKPQAQILSDFSGRINILTQAMLERLDAVAANRLMDSGSEDHAVILTIKFKVKPRISVCKLFNDLASVSNFWIARRTVRIDAFPGSFTEIILTTAQTVLAFQIFLYLANGCLIQLTELKQRIRVFLQKEPKEYYSIALKPRQQTPEALLAGLQAIAGSLGRFRWMNDPALRGLNNSNITDVKFSEIAPDAERQ